MGKSANSRCPECDTQVNVQMVDQDGRDDAVVKATSEEVILEIGCKEPDCSRVWRAVYTFSGNQ